MAKLTGLQIQKLLPKTNCKECGSNTCMAFAMKLAAKKADLSECPYASDEAQSILGAASEPPVRCIELGTDRSLKLGEETVLYRHEKTFVHQTALAVNVNDTDADTTIETTLNSVRDYVLERVGESLQVDMICVTQRNENSALFVALAKRAWDATHRPLVLRSSQPQALAEAGAAVRGSHSVLASATPESADMLRQVASDNQHALAVTATDLNCLAATTDRLKQDGFSNLLLEFPTSSLAERFQVNAIARRAALLDNFKPLGYPSLYVVTSHDFLDAGIEAIQEISKYGGICVLPGFDPAQLAALMTLRQNIYTDPQKPIQVEPKIYAIGDPTREASVFVTTNFSLTYFIVSGEIENSGTSAWLVVPECEGMSVLTAWAAGKFSGSTIARFMREVDIESMVTSRDVIIPGHVAQISGELEEGLPGWNVVVGPQEAADLESFIKARLTPSG